MGIRTHDIVKVSLFLNHKNQKTGQLWKNPEKSDASDVTGY